MTTEHITKGLDQFLQNEFVTSLKGKSKSFAKLRTNLQDAWDREKQSTTVPSDLAVGFLKKTEKVFSSYVKKAAKDADKSKRQQRQDGFLERAYQKLAELDPVLVEKAELIKVLDECLNAEFELSRSPSKWIASGSPHLDELKKVWDIDKRKSDLSPLQLGANFFMHTREGFKQEDAQKFLYKVREKLIKYDRALYFKIEVFDTLASYEQRLRKETKGSAELQEAAKNIREMCLSSSDDIPELYEVILANVKAHLVDDELVTFLGRIKERYERGSITKVSASEPALAVAAAPVVEVKQSTTPAPSPTKPTVVQTFPRAESPSERDRAAGQINWFFKAVSEVVVKGLDAAENLVDSAEESAAAGFHAAAEKLKDVVKKSPDSSRDSSRESTSASSQPSPATSPARKKQAEPGSSSELEMTGSPTGITPQGSPKGSSSTVVAQVVDPKQEAERAAKDKLIGELKVALEQEVKDETNSVRGKQAVIKDLDARISVAQAAHVKKTDEYNSLTQTITSEKELIRNGVVSAIQNKTERLSKDFRFAFRQSNMKKLDDAFAALPSEQFDANCRATAANVVKGLLGGLLSSLPGFLGGNFFKRRLDARVDAATDYLQDRKAQQAMSEGLTDQNAVAINNAAGRFANVNVGGLIQHLHDQTAKDAEVSSSHEAMQALISEKREYEAPLQKAREALWLLLRIKNNWSDVAEKLRADSAEYAKFADTWTKNDIYGRWKKVGPQLCRLVPEQELTASAQSSTRPGQKGH